MTLDQLVLGTFRFAYSLHAGLQVAKVAGPRNHWPDKLHFQTERSFSMMQDFRQSSEAVGLSPVSKMSRQLTGQISAHYFSSKI